MKAVDDGGSALSGGTVFETGDAAAPGEPEPVLLERGATLSRYLLVERLGVGGMGVVWSAYDPELDRKVAIKLLRPRSGRGGDELARSRLIREAQALAKLNHPNVIAVHGVGEHEGQVYLAMELVLGKTLGRWVRSTRRDWREIVAVFVQAGRGLAEAHRVGIVHRDFKPANVLIDADGRARVLDFGLARSAEAPRTEQDEDGGAIATEPGLDSWSASRIQELDRNPIVTPLTRTGALLGTPAYMAPEQFDGRQFDARADQFAFCVALWEALHRARPFAGTTIDELREAVCGGRISPATGDLRLPGSIDRALRRGLAVDPVDRWPSMDALLAELTRDPARARRRWLIAGGVVASFGAALIVAPMLATAPPVEPASAPTCVDADELREQLWPAEQRHELGLALLGRGQAPERWSAIAASLDAYADRYAQTRAGLCEGHSSGSVPEAASGERCLDDRRHAFATTVELLGRADAALLAGAPALLAALPVVESCARPRYVGHWTEITELEPLRPRLLDARMRAELGHVAGLDAELQALLQQADALDDAGLRVTVLIELGLIEQARGEPERARERLERAVDLAIRGEHDVLAARAALALIEVVGRELGEREAGLRWAARAEAWAERVDAPAVERAQRLVAEAELLADAGEVELATRRWLDGLALLGVSRAQPGPAQVDVAVGRVAVRAFAGLGRGARTSGLVHEARAWLQAAERLRRAIAGPDDRDAAALARELAELAG